MELQVRAARSEDLSSIVDANRRLASETEDLPLEPTVLEAGVRKVLSDPAKGFYLIGTVDGVFAGQLMITYEWSDWRNGCIWWIQSVYVLPEFRRLGVFKQLYRRAEQMARDAGAVGLRLYVERHNSAAQETYQRLGMIMTPYLVMAAMWDQPG